MNISENCKYSQKQIDECIRLLKGTGLNDFTAFELLNAIVVELTGEPIKEDI